MNLHKYILKLDLAYQMLKEAMDQLICSEGIGTPSFGTLNKIEEKKYNSNSGRGPTHLMFGSCGIDAKKLTTVKKSQSN